MEENFTVNYLSIYLRGRPKIHVVTHSELFPLGGEGVLPKSVKNVTKPIIRNLLRDGKNNHDRVLFLNSKFQISHGTILTFYISQNKYCNI